MPLDHAFGFELADVGPAAIKVQRQCRRADGRGLSGDWLPTFVEIAGGPKGDDLNKQIQEGRYPGIVKTKLDGFNQLAYLEGKSETSAREYFFYFSGTTPSAVRYKNWKMYYSMTAPGAAGWVEPLINFHWTIVQNIKRDPFEQAIPGVGESKTLAAAQGGLGGAVTAFMYDWNMLPIGQLLWEKELLSYREFPALQAAASYNLDSILKKVQDANANHPSEKRKVVRAWLNGRPNVVARIVCCATAAHDVEYPLATKIIDVNRLLLPHSVISLRCGTWSPWGIADIE